MTVYRVQDKDGRGPWKPGFSHRWVETRPDHDNLLPWPFEFGRVDRKAISGMHLGCGCKTLDQLRRWFSETEYDALLGLGYCAVKMKVGRILGESETQCVFERAKPLKSDVKVIHLY